MFYHIIYRRAVGARNSNVFISGGIIDSPKGSPLKPNIFDNQCLLVCIVLGILKNLSPCEFQKVQKLFYNNTSAKGKNQAADILEEAVNSLCEMCDINPIGPHVIEDVIPRVEAVFNVQISVIRSMEGSRPDFISFSPTFSYKMPRIYLYLLGVNHVVFIDNLKTFFRQHKKIVCFDCKRFFSYYYRSNHRCQKQKTCFNCDGILQTPETFCQSDEIVKFCDSELTNSKISPFICQNCNLTFRSHLCYQNHNQNCVSNSKGWKCLSCGIFQTATSKKVCEKLQAEHKCGEIKKRCEYCFLVKENNHICKIRQKLPHSIWPNLGFILMKQKKLGAGNCQDCYQLRKNYMDKYTITFPELFQSEVCKNLVCENHKNLPIDLKPNAICMYIETEREIFNEKIFCDDTFPVTNFIEKEIKFRYSNDPKPMSKVPMKLKRTFQNVSSNFEKKLKQEFNLAQKSALDKFMLYICKNKLTNYTFILAENNDMLTILQAFLKLNLVPEVIQNGNIINYLEIPTLTYSFLINWMLLKRINL